MSIPILGTCIPILGTFGCLNEWVEKPITVTREEFALYWVELERRWPAFFESQCVVPPPLPPMWEVFNKVTFLEVVADEKFVTCTYTRNGYEIRIGDDKWGSGCVPHEIGHAACHVLGNKFKSVCFNFEHPEYISQCKGE